jgi:hypothetical protein
LNIYKFNSLYGFNKNFGGMYRKLNQTKLQINIILIQIEFITTT